MGARVVGGASQSVNYSTTVRDIDRNSDDFVDRKENGNEALEGGRVRELFIILS